MNDWTALQRLFSAHGTAGRKILAGFDFDGTLSPLARRPGLARLPAETRRLLARLRRCPRLRLAVLSGRSLADVKARVGLRGVYFSGNHGLEIQGPGFLWRHPRAQAASSDLRKLAEELSTRLKEFPGIFFEDKGLTLSVHYRGTRRNLRPFLQEALKSSLRPYAGKLVLGSGKMVWEIRPKTNGNKGRALLEIARSLGKSWSLLFVGDDRTDEEGFRFLGRRAVTVRVGPAEESAARFRLGGQRKVRALLRLLCEALG